MALPFQSLQEKTSVPFKRILAVFLMLWLPLQAAYATSMQWCSYASQEHAQAGTASHQSDDAAPGDDAGQPGHEAACGQQVGQADSGGDSDCRLCHLAGGAFVSVDAGPGRSLPEGGAADLTVVVFHSVVPDPTHPPPVPASR